MSALLFLAMTALPSSLLDRLESLHLNASPRVLVVSIAEQQCAFFTNGAVRTTCAISTAEKGAGQVQDSYQTPLGLHRIKEKIGQGVPTGAIFVSRQLTGQLWKPPVDAQGTPEPSARPSGARPNLITSRILWLEGLEPGHNQGRDDQGRVVDTHERYIYFHGTNREAELGKPVSKGCIHMSNADIIAIFDQVETGDLVWIEP